MSGTDSSEALVECEPHKYAREQVDAQRMSDAKFYTDILNKEVSKEREKSRQQVEAFRERVAQRLEQMANVEKERQPQGASISRYVFEEAAAAIRAL